MPADAGIQSTVDSFDVRRMNVGIPNHLASSVPVSYLTKPS